VGAKHFIASHLTGVYHSRDGMTWSLEGPGRAMSVIAYGLLVGGHGCGIRKFAGRSCWACAILALARWCHCHAALMESNHCCFLLCGSPMIASIGQFSSSLDAWCMMSLPRSYFNHMSLSN